MVSIKAFVKSTKRKKEMNRKREKEREEKSYNTCQETVGKME